MGEFPQELTAYNTAIQSSESAGDYAAATAHSVVTTPADRVAARGDFTAASLQAEAAAREMRVVAETSVPDPRIAGFMIGLANGYLGETSE